MGFEADYNVKRRPSSWDIDTQTGLSAHIRGKIADAWQAEITQ